MLRLALLATLACVALSLPAQTVNSEQSIKDSLLRFHPIDALEQLWKEFKAKHGKAYEDTEESKRKDIFKANVKKIDFHNYLFEKGYKSYELGLNEYADMEHKEFIGVMNGYKMRGLGASSGGSTYLPPMSITQLPDAVDWRTKGYVTPVKNQGQCGSCWSFSTTGSLEGQHFRKSGKLVSLSEQNLVDCSVTYGNNGCNGGLMDNAFKYIKDNHGIDTEESYPYEAKDDTCRFTKRGVGADDTGFVDVPSGNETALTESLANVGPVSVAIDAAHPSFQLYKSGVYDEPECSSSQLDHGVLAVGYGTGEDGNDFYWVKNSWGETWGDQGYIKMSRNKDNQCGIATTASYPLV